MTAWLDHCGGSCKALIGTARISHDKDLDVETVGVDPAEMFRRVDPLLQVVEASLRGWRPDRSFDLIT